MRFVQFLFFKHALEQIRTIDKQRLKEYVCHIDSAMMQKVDKAIRISLEIAT